LAECFGKSEALQENCNQLTVEVVENQVTTKNATEIEKLYRIIDQYNLYGKIRWLECLTKPVRFTE